MPGCDLRDQKAPAGLAPNLLSHVSFSVFVVADERDMLDILERCAGMPFVTAETTVRGVTAAVVTGTLAQWRDAVAAGSVTKPSRPVRAGFNKVYGLFCGEGLNVWSDYRAREAPDRTLLLEYKPQDEALLRERQHHALLRRQPRGAADAAGSVRGFRCVPIRPTALGFMGHEWDHGVPGVPYWQAIQRVCKPGALMLAFGGTRTYHRLTCAIEDAGWEIRDCLMWLYGQGFPKAPDIGVLIDKAKGAKREVVGTKLGQPGYSLADNGRTNEVYGDLHNPAAECAVTAPATELAKQWTGWANALKPAWEPIILAMKPLDGTLAHNAETVGRGRAEHQRQQDRHGQHDPHRPLDSAVITDAVAGRVPNSVNGRPLASSASGRWPANLLLAQRRLPLRPCWT